MTLNTTVSPGSVTVNNSAGQLHHQRHRQHRRHRLAHQIRHRHTDPLHRQYLQRRNDRQRRPAGDHADQRNNQRTAKRRRDHHRRHAATGHECHAGSQASPTPASNVNITSLTITGNGTLDINNNHIIIDYTAGNDPIASIAALIKSGYAGGAWTGTGIMSTAAQSNSGSYGIGYADAADPGNPAGLVLGTD